MSTPRPTAYHGWANDDRRTDPQASFRNIPTPVVAIAAIVDDNPVVMIATSFSVGVSHDPPMCSFAVTKSTRTWPSLQRATHLGITMLGARHHVDLRQLSSRDAGRRLDGIEWTELPSGAVALYDGPVWLECVVVEQHPVGDHILVVVQVLASGVADEHEPLIHHNKTFGTYLASEAHG